MAWAEFRETKTGTAKRFKDGKWEKGSWYAIGRAPDGTKISAPAMAKSGTGFKTARDIIEAIENGQETQGNGKTIQYAYELYERHMSGKPGDSELTWIKYRRDLEAFKKFIKPHKNVDAITRDDMDEYRDSLIADDYHINSVFGMMGVIGAFLTFCRKKKFIKFSPASNVMEEYERIKTGVKFTDTEIRQILDCIDNPLYIKQKRNWAGPRQEFRAIIESTLLNGFREGDVANFKCTWIADGLIYVEDGKGGKNRIVPASARLMTILAPYLNRGMEYVFQGWSQNRIKCQWSNLYARAKIVFPALQKKKGTFHSLRHTFAKNFLRGGGNPKKLQRILGHATIGTTLDLYGDIDPEELGPDMDNVKAGWMGPELRVVG